MVCKTRENSTAPSLVVEEMVGVPREGGMVEEDGLGRWEGMRERKEKTKECHSREYWKEFDDKHSSIKARD